MKVSVLMSVYINDNSSDFILALNSVLNQIYKADEIVIVLDGPVKQEIENYIDHKISNGINIVKVKLESNYGLGIALNKGLQFCTNEFIARMDSDDISKEDRLLVQSNILTNDQELSIVGSFMYEFLDTPSIINYVRKLPLEKNEIIKFSRFRNPFNHPTVMFRKSDILKAGSYENILYFEDYFLWLKVLKLGFNVRNIKEPLLYFRMKNYVNRRRGIDYLKNELKFYKKVKERKLLPNRYIIFSLIFKLPIRLLPNFITKKIYHHFLRKNITF